MILSVDPSLALPVYEQVREQIRRMVVSGSLAPNSRLPTIRQLATDLGLAKGTIERAYELLEGDRVIERRGRNGTVVAQQPAPPTEVIAAELDAAAARLVVVARQLGVSEGALHDAVHVAWQAL